MIKLLGVYGHPKVSAAFDKYYQEAHIPIAKRMKGLKKWIIGKVLGTPDPSSQKASRKRWSVRHGQVTWELKSTPKRVARPESSKGVLRLYSSQLDPARNHRQPCQYLGPRR